jgi:hypothetical protein
MSETEVVGLSKMSIKALGCNPKLAGALPEGSKEVVRLCVIGGKASGVKHGEDLQGRTWTALIGTFEGVNIENGETFQSGKLFLPSGIQESVEAAVAKADGNDVSFAFELRAVKANNPIGYSYQAVSLMPPAEVDTLSDVRATFVKALAPAAVPAKQIAGKK